MAKAIVDVKSISETPTGLDLWNRLEVTDKAYTKPVSRPGGFKGTAVDPCYNIKRVTGELGPVGFAWGWRVLNERLDTFGTGDDAQTIHSLTVRAWFKQDDGSLLEVDHIGHTKVYYRTQGRWILDEEFGKKSLTDALSKIMMSLGASADIWLGRFDGNKYVPPTQEDEPPRGAKSTPKPAAIGTPHEEAEAAMKRADADPLAVRGKNMEPRALFVAIKNALAKADKIEADRLFEAYKDVIAGLPEAGRKQLEEIVVSKIKAAA